MLHRVHLCGIGTDRDRKTGALRARLAHNDASGLNYAGAAFIALASEERAQFLGELERLTTSCAAFKSSRMLDVKWCHPKLLVEVKHLVGSKTLRHATVRNFARLSAFPFVRQQRPTAPKLVQASEGHLELQLK